VDLLSTAVTFVKVLKQAPVATSFMLTRLETFQPQGGESFYSTAVTLVKVLKQWGLGLIFTHLTTGYTNQKIWAAGYFFQF
jgi:hypothetical protein